MPRKCSVCGHPQKAEIDGALMGPEGLRDIALRFQVSKDALFRHKADHLPATLTKAAEAEEAAHADDLLARLEGLTREARAIKDKAERAEDYRTALAGVRELVRIVELLAKLRGELDERPQVNVLVASPEWLTLRAAILGALDHYPEARLAVIRALEVGQSAG